MLIKDNRGYISYRVSGLPVGQFGETYVVTTAALGMDGIHGFEVFVISKRHEPHLYYEAFQFKPGDMPEELLQINEEYLFSEARQQAKNYLDDMLFQLAEKHGEHVLDRYGADLNEIRHMPLLSLWMRDELHREIEDISNKTQNPRLKLCLSFVMQSSVKMNG